MFKTRSQQKEMLDEIELDPAILKQNLREFTIINQWLGCKSSLIESLNTIYLKNKNGCLNKTISIADLGCGAGDLLISIQLWAQDKNIKVELIGIDCNPIIVEFAKLAVRQYPNIRIQLLDIFSPEFQNMHFDIVCLNNVCHHFTDKELNYLLNALKEQTDLAIIMNDLQRHPLAFYGIKWITRLFNFSSFAQNDGPLSVLKSFKIEDLKKYLTDAKISTFEIKKRWAYRWQVIIWCKENEQ